MQITPLLEGIFSVNATKAFIPFDSLSDPLSDRPARSVVLAVQSFLVCTQQDYILLDTGLGLSQDNQIPLVKALKQHGVNPEQITKVILSHLHKDHTGGLGYWQEDGRFTLTFARANYYIQQRELVFARQQTGNPSYDQPLLDALATHPQMTFLQADTGLIGNQISFTVSGGHTPFHQTILIREGVQTVFFGSDELPQSSYIQQNFAYKNDYNGKRAMDSRRHWIEQAKVEDWTLLYHDSRQPIIQGQELAATH